MEDARDIGAVGYAARLWAQLSLPYKDPGDTGLWIRRNGSLTLRVNPGLTGPKGAEKSGYPYGVLPRYVLTWMSTEAVRTQSPVLQLGSNLSDFMDRLGLSPTGGKNGTITRLNDQMRRLLTSSMYVEDNRDGESRWGIAGAHFSVATGFQLWYNAEDRIGEKPLWGSTITLADAFYESIVSAPVPVDTRAFSALAGSPLKLDLLVWLSHRLGYVRRTQLVPWAALSEQFGSDYARLRDFKAVILRQLRDVLAVYPGANVPSRPTACCSRHQRPQYLGSKLGRGPLLMGYRLPSTARDARSNDGRCVGARSGGSRLDHSVDVAACVAAGWPMASWTYCRGVPLVSSSVANYDVPQAARAQMFGGADAARCARCRISAVAAGVRQPAAAVVGPLSSPTLSGPGS